jgi:hypothetical protein
MRRIMLAAVFTLALPATSFAQGSGFNLAWNDCFHGTGTTIETFACDVDAGTHTLVVSAYAPGGMDEWCGFEAAITLHSTAAAIPDWWRLRNQAGQLGQCRNGSLTTNVVGTNLSGCTDPYQGQGAGGISTYQVAPNGQAHQARLLVLHAVPAADAHPLTEGEEYFVAKVVFSNAKTTGASACAGCPEGACIVVDYVKAVQVAGAPGGDVQILYANESPGVTWQNAQLSITDCGVSCYEPGKPSLSNCAICPTVNATWGRIKAIYR